MGLLRLNAVVLHAALQGEADKRVMLYSAERGRVFAVCKGVVKPTAKLKPAAQLFTMGEFELQQTHDRLTVTGITVTESFYELAKDPDRYMSAAALCEVYAKCTLVSESQPPLFVLLAKALAALTAAAPTVVLCKALLQFLHLNGYAAANKPGLSARVYDFLLSVTDTDLAAEAPAPSSAPAALTFLKSVCEAQFEVSLPALAALK